MTKAAPEFVCSVRFEAPLPPPGLDARLVARRAVDAETLAQIAATPIELGPADASAAPAVPYDVLASELFDTVDLERFAPCEAETLSAEKTVSAATERRDSKASRPRMPSSVGVAPAPVAEKASSAPSTAATGTVRDVIAASFAPGPPVHPADATLEAVRVVPLRLAAGPSPVLAAFDGAIPTSAVLVDGCALYEAPTAAGGEVSLVREYDAQPAAGSRHYVLWMPSADARDSSADLEPVGSHVSLKRRRATGTRPRVLSL